MRHHSIVVTQKTRGECEEGSREAGARRQAEKKREKQRKMRRGREEGREGRRRAEGREAEITYYLYGFSLRKMWGETL